MGVQQHGLTLQIIVVPEAAQTTDFPPAGHCRNSLVADSQFVGAFLVFQGIYSCNLGRVVASFLSEPGLIGMGGTVPK